MSQASFFVRVPASSANLGPGFDALGMALSVHLEMGPVINGQVPVDAKMIDEYHPGRIAFRTYGGVGDVWMRSKIPMGRGLGFSGAARVAGGVAAHAPLHGVRDDHRGGKNIRQTTGLLHVGGGANFVACVFQRVFTNLQHGVRMVGHEVNEFIEDVRIVDVTPRRKLPGCDLVQIVEQRSRSRLFQ